jgi:ClpP class serine protease
MHVAQQMLNRPLLVTEDHAALMLSAIRSRLNLNLIYDIEGHPRDIEAMEAIALEGRTAAVGRDARREDRKIFVEDQGVAIIPIVGTLTKSWGLDPFSGITGYDGIKAKLLAAASDDTIAAILLDIDSPGGGVLGCMDLADLIFALNEQNGGKLIWAMTSGQMDSAAFALGCGADRVWVARDGEIGSVGVMMCWTNMQKMNEMVGIEARLLRNRSSTLKARGGPLEPLDAATEERFLDEMDEMAERFIETVARGRGLSKKAVRDSKGLTYMGAHAQGMKFATDVGSDDQVWAQLMRHLGR